jgi:zinc protease
VLAIDTGTISMACLREDLSYALELLKEVLTECTFPEEKIAKVRNQLFASCKMFWDNPWQVANHLTYEIVYKNHPYSKSTLGTFQSLESIKQEDLKSFYQQHIVPCGAAMAVVGDLRDINIPELFGSYFAGWSGPQVIEPEFPVLVHEQKQEVNFAMNRDQVVLILSSLSIDRFHPDYDKLVLFDQILSGGGLNSKLMQLREHTGLFYTINGSTIAHAGLHQGMVVVRTMVSLDRLQEAQDAIINLLHTVVDTITQQELDEAKNAIAQSLIGYFDMNAKMAGAFLFLQKYGFKPDYFDHRARDLAAISLEEVKKVAKDRLDPNKMHIVRVGRVQALSGQV